MRVAWFSTDRPLNATLNGERLVVKRETLSQEVGFAGATVVPGPGGCVRSEDRPFAACHQTWFERLKLWRHAYKTKVLNPRDEVSAESGGSASRCTETMASGGT